jgi:hypothetical protein
MDQSSLIFTSIYNENRISSIASATAFSTAMLTPKQYLV